MKRIVFFFFILAATGVVWFPSLNHPAALNSGPSHQAKRPHSKVQKLATLRSKLRHPHEDSSVKADQFAEIERATRSVASALPELSPEQIARQSPKTLQLAAFDNPIDVEIFKTLAARGVEPAQLATDEEFCRRVTLDITGRQPVPDRLLKYVADNDPQKKEKLLAELMNSDAFVDRWTLWMGDVTRNFALSEEASERNAQYLYLRQAVEKNLSWRQIATDLITFTGRCENGPGGFLERPASATEIDQDAFDEMTAETIRTFLGTQAVCISCHNGQGHLEQVNLFFSQKKRSDFWALSAFFAQTELKTDDNFKEVIIKYNSDGLYDANTREGIRPPRTGGVIEPSYAVFGDGKPKPDEDRRQALARILTADPQFARAFANRVFAHFFTFGIVEPLDGFDLARLDPQNPPPPPWELQPSHPMLLEKLAGSFQENGYDLKALIGLITRSQAYALSSRYDESKWKPEYTRLFARKLARRLDAEEVFDGITAATLKPGQYQAIGFDQPFTSTMALPGVEEPSDGPHSSDDPFVVFNFLQNFGRGDRMNIPRSNNGSITQSLALFNSDLLISRIESEDGLANQLGRAVHQGNLSLDEALTRLFLNTVGRQPSPKEALALKERIKDNSVTFPDLQWALFNRVDYLYNY